MGYKTDDLTSFWAYWIFQI